MSSEKVFVVTGANRGIGLALATQLSAFGKVIATVRSKEAAKSSPISSLKNVELVELDIGSESSIDAASEAIAALAPTGVDEVWNNAGVNNVAKVDPSISTVSYKALQRELEINSIGPVYFTSKLIPLLEKRDTKKILFITSMAGSLTIMSGMPDAIDMLGVPYVYPTSKAALNYLGFFLHHYYGKKGFTVVLLHPGFVMSDMGKAVIPDPDAVSLPFELLQPEQSAEKLIQTASTIQVTDKEYAFAVRNYDGSVLPF
ncbi:hypothetical protein V1512DRAFT_273601 [Lipomyces arxii]|uniref:uncharacterized protein n=1 Tax=Lipomyces arxii TaxID=56418 RepID=UPI0034CF21D3